MIFFPLNSNIIHDRPTSCPAPLKHKIFHLIYNFLIECTSSFAILTVGE